MYEYCGLRAAARRRSRGNLFFTMKHVNKLADKAQLKMPFLEPLFHVPVIKLRQPDGSLLVRAGQPQIVEPEVSVFQFHKTTGISIRYISQLCEQGFLVHRRLSPKRKSKILIPRSEICRFQNLRGEI